MNNTMNNTMNKQSVCQNSLSRKAPSFGEDIVLLWEHFIHSIQVSGQQILPTYFTHSWEVVNFLKIHKIIKYIHNENIIKLSITFWILQKTICKSCLVWIIIYYILHTLHLLKKFIRKHSSLWTCKRYVMNTKYCGVSTWYFFISMTRSRATE